MLPFRHGTAWRALFLLCVLSYFINVASSEGRVVCYYTNWSVYRPGTAKFNPQNINPYLCTHLIYAFGGFTKDNQMKPFDKYQDIEQGGYAKFTGLKTYNKQLKTMIAIGGWNEASSRFSPLVANPERRQQFIKNILKFLRQNHFDGIDLDWEYPAHREGGKSRDRDNYAEFVRELRAEFERESEKTGRTRLLLTMAVPAGIEYIDKGYDVPKLNKYLDWFNVLTYDFHSSHEPSVNHHAPLYSLEDDSEYNYDAELNIDYSIKYYLKAGADRDKLVLGIPTYGRSYTLINEESTELGAPSEGPGEQGDATREKGYLAYYEICQTLKDDPDWTVVQPNENVMGPYAYRRNQWVGYDDEAIVRKKAEYVVAHGLGGIMFWAIDNDDFRGACSGKPYPLIEAAKEAMLEAFGLGINEVGKPSSPQKPSRSRGRDRNQLTSKPDSGASRQSATRRPAVSSTTTVTPRSTAAIRLTEAEGSSLYIGGRGSTTPAPPTTPDPGSDFKCEEEGFFQHPRDCKKYYWCLDSGPSGLGIVGHQFTCPSGLYFNPAADSCDFARNVPCKTKKSTTSPPITTTTAKTTTTTTRRPASNQNRVTAAPVARPIYPRVSSTTSTTTTTTSTTTTAAPEVIEYDEEDGNEEHSVNRFNDAEEDPQVIKELIDLIRKVGGVEKLEKHLLQNKDGSITLKEHSASVSGNGAPTTPSTISKSLYDRVLKRPGTFNAFTRNRVQVTETTESSKTLNNAGAESSGEGNSQSQSSYSKYSSVVRGNSRQGPQNEGIDKIAESEGFLKERKQYVTINRNRGVNREEHDTELTANNETDDEELDVPQPETTTRRPLSAATPSYTSLRRARPSTTTKPAPLESESEEEQEEERRTVVKEQQTQTKHYATLSRTRGRTTERSDIGESEGSGVSVSSTTNRYKYVERTRPTTSSSGSRNAVSDAIDDEADEDDEEEYEDDSQQKNNRYQLSRTRGSGSTTSRTTTTTTTTTAPPTARRFAFGTRSRTQVTKLATRDPQTNDESDEEEDGEEGEADSGEDQEDAATETTTAKITLTATTTTTTTAPPTATKPTLKRVRVIKYRRPLQSIDSNDSDNDSTNSTTNSVATRTHTESQNTNTTTTTTTTTILNSESNNNGTTRKRFRKIVRKLRPVDVAQTTTVEPEIKVKTDQDQHAVSGSETTTTTRKPFHPSRSRFESSQKQEPDEKEVSDDDVDVDVEQNKVLLPQRRPNDLQSLRNRLKAQQAQGEGTDGVISTRLTGSKSNEAAHTGEESELQKLRDKVKAEQARGSGEQGVINDRLKKVLAEKNANAPDRLETTTRAGLTLGTGSSPRPFFRRKLVAKRPIATISTINSTRSTTTTATYKRRKNGRFDPFNSSVQNKGEGFVRTDPRGRLDANRFKQQQQQQEEDNDDDDDDEDDDSYEAQQELPQTQVNVRPALANQEIVRRPFVPIKKLPQPPVRQTEESQEEDEDEDENEDDEEDEGEDDNEDEQVEKQSQAPHSSQELDSSTNQPKSNSPYRPNRVLPGSRPNIAPTAGGNAGNVPYNSRNRNASSSSVNSSSSTSSSTPANRFGSSNRPRVVNRPLGVATPNLTLRPVANNYERTTPLTPLKPAPFIPSNTRSYERKYTGPSTETPEISLENSLIEDLNIDALNARNKKIFDIHSKKHTTLKPKVATKEAEAETEQEAGAEAEVANKQQQQLLEENQGYVTTTPSTPTETTTTSPNPTQITQQSTDTTVTNTETETTIDSIDNDTAQPPTNVFNANANEATNISSLFTQNHRSPASALSSTTSPPPPATTLLHVFTLLDGETNDGDDHEPTGRPATTSKNRHKITASVEPKHKLIEINRIVEINSKQARLAQRKSKANQEFSPGILRVESLPHVEQLGEISVVKYVHLVDGSDIQVNDGHSTVADYTPTESIIPKSVSSSAPVRNSLPETESSSVGDSDSERNGKSLLPEVIREAFETSTISLEGLFDSARKAKLLNINNNINGNSNSNSEDEEVKSSTIHQELEKEQEQQQQQDSTETAIPATYLRTPTATTTTTATATTTTTMTTATAALTSTATATVSRRPVLSVRRRIINTPVAKSEATTQPTDELLTTTSNKYIRRGSKQSTAAAASAATTTTTSATSTSNIHLSKLKTQSSSATIYSNNNNNNNNGSSVGNINVDSPQQQQKQHKFQAASFALRRQFQTRRLTTTASPANNDESSTEVPRTQNPLFKRRLTLTSTAQPPRTTTIAPEITTDFGIDNDGDQVAKSSIQSSQFNQIPEQVRPASISTTAPHFTVNNSTRRQLIARPRRPQSVTSTTTAAPEFAPPLSRRQQSRRRPHKYIEVYNRPPGKPALTTPLPAPTNPAAIRRSSAYNDYTDDSQPQLRKKSKKQQPQSSPKVVLHGRGIIECLDEGNFPHPNSCRKFISCAKFVETGGIVGWEYTCPKGLGYDSLSGMCTYVTTSDGKACRD
ncbi:serine-rich adhesin for platelets isoform X3 [Drosophila sulfurigaster albostrigata]|uniref:serine-rich adhesin for platelets isoform X3 n=1 Tax=Drosophila sulfurigaster albostrigata TaxID=89887 RepID=UPI002D2193C0|nr:serine-rich adhesin for platelets isoform X3 [Drosophila sulfurigaster albostrigata]